jgi:hypothetical protein
MSLRMSRRKWEKMTRAEQAAVEAARAEADHCIVTRARKVVRSGTARSELFFYPTIRAAITAECPWLDYNVSGLLPDW